MVMKILNILKFLRIWLGLGIRTNSIPKYLVSKWESHYILFIYHDRDDVLGIYPVVQRWLSDHNIVWKLSNDKFVVGSVKDASLINQMFVVARDAYLIPYATTLQDLDSNYEYVFTTSGPIRFLSETDKTLFLLSDNDFSANYKIDIRKELFI
jgi:hypothetical protein